MTVKSAIVENKKENLKFFLIVILTWFSCFFKPLIGKTYTSWDTHDLGFVNFLYFSDSLRSGVFPLWNHFIQSGTFFPSFNNIGLFSPFQLIFVALSWIISPVYAFELMIQAAVLVGAVGSYLLFRCYTRDKLIALFGATVFVVTVLVPIVGQIAFVVSLSSFPWLVLACIKITERPGAALNYFILGILGAFYLASGYLWMNLVNLSIVVIFALSLLWKRRRTEDADRKAMSTSVFHLLAFFGTMVFLYACLILPGYLSMGFNYSLFSGDYQNPEPRLRSLQAAGYFAYNSILKALVGTVDPRIYVNNAAWMADMPRWSWGGGWALLILFLGLATRKLLAMQRFWLILLIIAILYSAGNSNYIGKLVTRMPVLNANRWMFIGVFYATICLVFLSVPALMALKERVGRPQPKIFSMPRYDFQVLLVGVFAVCLLGYFKSSPFQFALVALIVVLLMALNRAQNLVRWKKVTSVLLVVNVLAIASMPYGIRSISSYQRASGPDGYSQKIREREKDVVITKNIKTVGSGDIYIFNDEQWLLKKIPFTHGYNNLGNPFVWYLRNEPFLGHLVVVTQNVREELPLERKNFASDNEYAKAMMGDVLVDMEHPTIDARHMHKISPRPDFDWKLDKLLIEPNAARMQVSTNASAYLLFNNTNHPGWNAYVNGKKVDLVSVNRIFQGVFLADAGTYEVEFKFRPWLTISLISLPYVFLIFGLVALLWRIRRRGKLHED